MHTQLDVLAFGAHPDDIELMCAGTLAKFQTSGFKVGVISLTAGEKGTRGNIETRRAEFSDASEILALDVAKILNIPDGNIENTEENRLLIIDEIRTYRPRLVFTSYWNTRHPDHSKCSEIIQHSVFYSGLKNLETAKTHYRPQRIIYYMELFDFEPTFIVDISETFTTKMKSIKAYESQFYNPRETQEESTFISSPQFLEMIETKAKYWGQKIGVRYGEPFFIREILGIAEIHQLFHAVNRGR